MEMTRSDRKVDAMRSGIIRIRGWQIVCPMVIGVLAACSGPERGGDWYDQSRGVKEDKAGYIEAQTRMGMSEADAARQYELERAIRQTEGRDPMVSPRPSP